MISKYWEFKPAATPQVLQTYRGIHPIVAQILYNRGITDPQQADAFIYARDELMHDPFDMPDMDKAVQRIRQAIKNKEKIVVYGDFDADGVTSTALMMQVLKFLKANAEYYIPNRADEGYGLNAPALKELADKGVTLVITVDCGIRSVQEVEDGKNYGLDIIITDHHSLGPELPDAYAVINCKRPGYPEPMLAGVGVAFKLAQALITVENKTNGHNGRETRYDNLLDLVAIGTVADLMPLNSLENRALVRRGLETLNKAKRPGVQALLEVANLEAGKLTTSSIGFGIGPRINAAGRLDDAMIAVKMLRARTKSEAETYAKRLQELNEERQEITRAAHEQIRETLVYDDTIPLIFARGAFPTGIVGLVAGRLCEEYYRPVIVMEMQEDDEECRASCRSIPHFDITAALDQCADLLVRHGGHALAAGFTVHKSNIPALEERMTALAREALDGEELRPVLHIDKLLDIHDLSDNLVDELNLLEPMGNELERPVFAVKRVRATEVRTVGKDNRHLKLKIARAGQYPLDAIGFGLGEWADILGESNACIDLAFALEINEWYGRKNLQLNLQDIRLSDQQ